MSSVTLVEQKPAPVVKQETDNQSDGKPQIMLNQPSEGGHVSALMRTGMGGVS